jgi:hypothetical protein
MRQVLRILDSGKDRKGVSMLRKKLMGRAALAMLAVLFAVVVAGCDTTNGPDKPGSPTALTGTVSIAKQTTAEDSDAYIKMGSTLKATVTSSNASTFNYQWQKRTGTGAFTNIGTNSDTYVIAEPVAALDYIKVVVTPTSADYTGSKESNAVQVRADRPEVTAVTISAEDDADMVTRGHGLQFYADVTGTGLLDEDQAVTWSVTAYRYSEFFDPPELSSGTTIDENGYLTVARNEDNGTLTVTATSVTDNTVTSSEIEITLIDPEPNTVIITGLSQFSAVEYLTLSVRSDFSDRDPVAQGYGSITNGSATFELRDSDWRPWDGSGSYWLMLEIGDSLYIYTNGADYNAVLAFNSKYTFTQAESTIAFNLFQEVQLGAGGHQLTITGLSGYDETDVSISVVTIPAVVEETVGIAYGYGTVYGGSVTITLINAADRISGWNAGGAYHIALQTYTGDDVAYLYTDGKTLEQLGISSFFDCYKADKYTFSGTSSSIAFDKFVPISHLIPVPGTIAVTITDLPGGAYSYMYLYKDGNWEAYGDGEIDDNTAVYNFSEEQWDGTGSYQIKIYLDGYYQYVYTGGAELEDLGIVSYDDVDANLPEYDFDANGLELSFSDFRLVDFSTEGQTITITGMDSLEGEMINVMINTNDWMDPSYEGNSEVSGGVLEAALSTWDGIGWDGTGSFKITLTVNEEGEWGPEPIAEYVYTGGAELEDLGIITMSDLYDDKLPLYDFGNGTTIDFDQFRDPSGLEW